MYDNDNQYESAQSESPNGPSRREWVADFGDGSVLPPDHAPLRNAECVGFSEIDRHAEAIYRYHYDHRNHGDATELVPGELPDFDFLIGGFPCQAFSIAGKRQGFDDARGTLFFEIARVLSHKRPAHFLLENVKGLSSHDDGRTIIRLHSILSELGYRVERVLLNSKDYGVPQNRERVFFIGHLGDRCSREILSVGNGYGETFPAGYERPVSGTISTKNQSGQCQFDGSTTLIGTLRTHKDGEGFREMQSGLAPALNARARQDGSQQGVIQLNPSLESGGKQPYQQNRIYNDVGVAPALNAELSSGSIAIPVLTPDRSTKRQNGRRMKEQGEASFTLTAQDQHGVYNGSRIRRLTPVECERLQGLPDQYTALGRYGDEVKEVSDTQRYKGLGNAFTVNVIEAIVGRMLEKGCLE